MCLGRAFAAEFRVQDATLRSPDTEARRGAPGWLERAGSCVTDHFLKPNATENLLARDTLHWMAAAARRVDDGGLIEYQCVTAAGRANGMRGRNQTRRAAAWRPVRGKN